MTIPGALPEQMADLYRRVAELERRARNRKRTGTVSEVDHAKGLARVKIAHVEGREYLSPWLPWKEVASGGIKSHIPPTVGEQVTVVSENGDLTDAEIDMSIPSNANPRPHDGPEAVITKGQVRITISDDETLVQSPNVRVEAESVDVEAQSVDVEAEKAVVTCPEIHLGDEGGPAVARVGDLVNVTFGSSAGLHPIVQGSGRVFAAD